MPKKTDPKRELARLKDHKERLKEKIAEAEKRLHLRLGRLVCEAGADALDEKALSAILNACVALGGERAMTALKPKTASPGAGERPPVVPAAKPESSRNRDQ